MRQRFLLLVGCFLAGISAGPSVATEMETVRVSPDGNGFILKPSGRPFVPWGMNYSSNDLEERWDKNWLAIEADLVELKRLGANVLRIHLQFNKFMESPDKAREHSLRQLGRFLKLAEKHGLYLDVTGLACYVPANYQPWYDALNDQQRWTAQVRFWQAIARQCSASPVVFCYDLMNEPISPGGTRKPGQWYSGQLFGGCDYLQFIALDQAGRQRDLIARDWARTLASAIRKEDPRHMITVGLLPTLNGTWFFGFIPSTLAPEVDFISAHIYPDHKDPADAMKVLQQFVVPRKPLVVEETFPLNCSAEELRRFLLESRETACGWMGHYLGKTQRELEELKKSGPLSQADTANLQWFLLFQEIRGQMVEGAAPPASAGIHP